MIPPAGCGLAGPSALLPSQPVRPVAIAAAALSRLHNTTGPQEQTMALQVLQINYTFAGSREDFEEQFGPAAADIAAVPGLRWKVWLFDEATFLGGGWYLFDDEATLHAYLDGPIVASIKSHPAFSNLSVQTAGVLEGPTAITRGPLAAASE
jgi:hypothetical protein